MKYLYRLSLFVLFVTFISCKKNSVQPKVTIIGKWTLKSEHIVTYYSYNIGTDIDTLNFKTGIFNVAASNTLPQLSDTITCSLQFNADSTFESVAKGMAGSPTLLKDFYGIYDIAGDVASGGYSIGDKFKLTGSTLTLGAFIAPVGLDYDSMQSVNGYAGNSVFPYPYANMPIQSIRSDIQVTNLTSKELSIHTDYNYIYNYSPTPNLRVVTDYYYTR